jgi:hypothetical protein
MLRRGVLERLIQCFLVIGLAFTLANELAPKLNSYLGGRDSNEPECQPLDWCHLR